MQKYICISLGWQYDAKGHERLKIESSADISAILVSNKTAYFWKDFGKILITCLPDQELTLCSSAGDRR